MRVPIESAAHLTKMPVREGDKYRVGGREYVLGPYRLWYLRLAPEVGDKRSNVGVAEAGLDYPGHLDITPPWGFDLVDGKWVLLEDVGGCTCAGPFPEQGVDHEPHCGWVFAATMDDVQAAMMSQRNDRRATIVRFPADEGRGPCPGSTEADTKIKPSFRTAKSMREAAE